jgi:hypothetical protein
MDSMGQLAGLPLPRKRARACARCFSPIRLRASTCLLRRSRNILALGALLVSASVRADRGALTLDLGAGAAGLRLPAPYASSGGTLLAADFEAMLGLRYAVTNELEFSVASFFEPRLSYTHDDVKIPGYTFSGSLTHALYVFEAVGGIRYVVGSVWRLVLGLEGGWSHRSYTRFQPTGLLDGFSFPAFGTDNIVVQPLIGVEWAFADHWSASLIPRFTVLIGPDATVGVSLMLSISYSWFL